MEDGPREGVLSASDPELGDSDGRGEEPGTAFAGGWNDSADHVTWRAEGTGLVVLVTFGSRFPVCCASVRMVVANIG